MMTLSCRAKRTLTVSPSETGESSAGTTRSRSLTATSCSASTSSTVPPKVLTCSDAPSTLSETTLSLLAKPVTANATTATKARSMASSHDERRTSLQRSVGQRGFGSEHKSTENWLGHSATNQVSTLPARDLARPVGHQICGDISVTKIQKRPWCWR